MSFPPAEKTTQLQSLSKTPKGGQKRMQADFKITSKKVNPTSTTGIMDKNSITSLFESCDKKLEARNITDLQS